MLLCNIHAIYKLFFWTYQCFGFVSVAILFVTLFHLTRMYSYSGLPNCLPSSSSPWLSILLQQYTPAKTQRETSDRGPSLRPCSMLLSQGHPAVPGACKPWQTLARVFHPLAGPCSPLCLVPPAPAHTYKGTAGNGPPARRHSRALGHPKRFLAERVLAIWHFLGAQDSASPVCLPTSIPTRRHSGLGGASRKRRLRNAGPAHVARAGEGREERGEALEGEVGSAGLAQAGPGDRAPVRVCARASAPR